MECRKAREGRAVWAGREGWAGQRCSASPPLGSPLAFPTLGTVVGALSKLLALRSDPDPIFHFDADPDPDLDPSFQIKAQNLKKSAQIL